MTSHPALQALVLPIMLYSMVLLSGCTVQSEAPECPYQDQSEPKGNAGCLILSEKGILVVERRLAHDLDFPGGTADDGESARCTAFRETFEETGHLVDVGEQMVIFEGGYRLFQCTTKTPEAPLMIHDRVEISRAFWRPVDQMSPDQWRFPKQFEQIQHQ